MSLSKQNAATILQKFHTVVVPLEASEVAIIYAQSKFGPTASVFVFETNVVAVHIARCTVHEDVGFFSTTIKVAGAWTHREFVPHDAELLDRWKTLWSIFSKPLNGPGVDWPRGKELISVYISGTLFYKLFSSAVAYHAAEEFTYLIDAKLDATSDTSTSYCAVDSS